MLAYHTYIGSNNKQNCVFPLEYMYLTQGEGGSYSHQGTLAMDFIGYNANGRVYQCPYYAPCDLTLVARPDDYNHVYVYTSNSEVNFIDGTTGYFTIQLNHDDNVYSIGRTVLQGDILGYTGTTGNVSGDHVHIETKKGSWEGFIRNSYGVWCMKNAEHIYNLLGVNDTVLVNDGGYNWREFADVPPTPTIRRNKFPWVLYARKLRTNRNMI